jgi:hypothetical protein
MTKNIQGWIHGYLKDHDRLSFSNEVIYRKNHGVKYKNVITNCYYSIHSHNIPSYIFRELKKRVWKAKELK